MYLPVTNDCDEYVIGSDGLPGGYMAGSGILRDLGSGSPPVMFHAGNKMK